MADQTIQLVVRKGPRPGQVFALTQDAISIGRDPLSDIVLDDPEVSRQHARLSRVGDSYHLQDAGSTNGTFVDGQRLSGEAVPLKPGQVVMMGSNVTLIAQATSESDPMATMIAPSQEPQEVEPAPEMPSEPAAESEAPEMEEMAEAAAPKEPDMATMLEESAFAGDDMDSESEPEDATELLPSFEEPAEPDFPELFPAEQEPLPSFEEAPPPPGFEEPEPEPMPSFDEPAPEPKFPEPEPSFEEPVKFDSGEPMGDFEPEPPPTPPPPPPSPDAGDAKEPDPNRNRNIIIAVVVILLLCCCCVLIAAVVAVANSPGGFDLNSFSALLPAAGSAYVA